MKNQIGSIEKEIIENACNVKINTPDLTKRKNTKAVNILFYGIPNKSKYFSFSLIFKYSSFYQERDTQGA